MIHGYSTTKKRGGEREKLRKEHKSKNFRSTWPRLHLTIYVLASDWGLRKQEPSRRNFGWLFIKQQVVGRAGARKRILQNNSSSSARQSLNPSLSLKALEQVETRGRRGGPRSPKQPYSVGKQEPSRRNSDWLFTKRRVAGRAGARKCILQNNSNSSACQSLNPSLSLRALVAGRNTWEKGGPCSPKQPHSVENACNPRKTEPLVVPSHEGFFLSYLRTKRGVLHARCLLRRVLVWVEKRKKNQTQRSDLLWNGFAGSRWAHCSKKPNGQKLKATFFLWIVCV